jgi:hypothetical protein
MLGETAARREAFVAVSVGHGAFVKSGGRGKSGQVDSEGGSHRGVGVGEPVSALRCPVELSFRRTGNNLPLFTNFRIHLTDSPLTDRERNGS